jgi:hypothetical protein
MEELFLDDLIDQPDEFDNSLDQLDRFDNQPTHHIEE